MFLLLDLVQLKGKASAVGIVKWVGEHHSQRWYGIDLTKKTLRKVLYASAQKYVHPMETLQETVLVQGNKH